MSPGYVAARTDDWGMSWASASSSRKVAASRLLQVLALDCSWNLHVYVPDVVMLATQAL